MPPEAKPKRKSERTQEAILQAAEVLFARNGFDGTRLEDVAEAVGIRRPSISYYFRDKRELYQAVQDEVLSGMRQRLLTALARGDSPLERIENCITAWVHYVTERPATAYIIMREIVETPGGRGRAAQEYLAPVVAAIREEVEEGQRRGHFRSAEPVHFVFNIVGATTFFVTAAPILIPDTPFDPLSPEQQEGHLFECLSVARRLLGIEPGARVSSAS